ncbi:hypothetical protein GCM10028772_02990 [Nocardioides ultimimeridianus]
MRSELAEATRIEAKHKFIRPHCPWQNGKVERFNRTLATEWIYRQVFTTNAERAAALAPWLEHYNTQRCHSALGGPPGQSTVTNLDGRVQLVVVLRGMEHRELCITAVAELRAGLTLWDRQVEFVG